eukprot:symbB.v1.2.032279.t1/scaffold3851.1/size49257/3
MYHVQAEPYSLLGPVDERLRRLGPHRTVSEGGLMLTRSSISCWVVRCQGARGSIVASRPLFQSIASSAPYPSLLLLLQLR